MAQTGSSVESDNVTEGRCNLCGGFGWLHPITDGVIDYSQVIRCQCCDRSDAMDRQRRLMKWCALPERTEHKLLGNFQTYGEEVLEKALRYSKSVAMRELDVVFLTLISESDRGKSHLGIGICHEWLNRGEAARYVNVSRMLNELRDGYEREGNDSFYSRLKLYCDVGLLVFDDFGSEKITEWGAEQLQTIVNSRYDDALYTVVTSNRPIDDLFNTADYRYETWRELANMRLESRLQREDWCRVVVLDTIAHADRNE